METMKKKITIVDKDLNQLVVVADCSSALYLAHFHFSAS